MERVLEEPELLDDALVGRRDVAVGPLAVVAPRLSTIFLGDLCGESNLRRVRAESSVRPPRHRRGTCYDKGAVVIGGALTRTTIS